MSKRRTSVVLKPPNALPIEQVGVDLKQLFLKLGEVAAQGGLAMATGGASLPNLITAVFGAADVAERRVPPEELAWRLIRNAIFRAMAELVGERSERRPWPGDVGHLQSRIEIHLDQADVVIDRQFFRNPASLPLLPRIRSVFGSWLRLLHLADAEADALAGRLDSYFSLALYDEWKTQRVFYEPLLRSFDNPFADVAELAADWDRYRLELVREMDRPVFEEAFSLRQVYVPLRAERRERVDEPATSLRRTFEDSDAPRFRRVVVDLLEEVDQWIDHAWDVKSAILLVSGGPGSGKSSFARYLAARLSGMRPSHADPPIRLQHRPARVLFIPLKHPFNIRERLEDAIGEHLATRFLINPLTQTHFATSDRRLLLIFDGLDELTKPGHRADEETIRFLIELRLTLDRWNAPECRVLAVVTGRTIAIQSSRALLRLGHGQELTILPYFVPENHRGRYHDPGRRLPVDQRDEWWRRYASAKLEEPRVFPEVLRGPALSDLTAEPLLNYLVVLSGYHRQPPQTEGVNRNAVYFRLFQAVVERRHAGGDRLATVVKLGDELFTQVMEAIAVAAWHGDGRSATLAVIREQCRNEALSKAFDRLVQYERGHIRLFAPFYIQQAETSGHESSAFEFTHKSFGEYLAARRLVRQIERMCTGLIKTPEYYTEHQAMTEWFQICGPQPVTAEILEFMRDQVALVAHKKMVSKWQNVLARLFCL